VGTTVHVYFPAHKGGVEAGPAVVNTLPSGTERILLVDDEDAMVAMGEKMLGFLGYNVEARTSSPEALELFREDPLGFDLVITDMAMPKMTGAVLARKIMDIRPDIPIIICTGFSERMNRDQASELGIRAFLQKPLGMKDLSLTLRRVLDESANQSEV
jgi:CheY-like chemotaxis protein